MWFRLIRNLRDCLGESERFVFKVEKLLNDIKDLKTVRNKAQNQGNRPSLPKKLVTAAIARYPLKENGSPPTRTRRCFARICCSRSLLQILIEIRFSCTLPFPLWEHCCVLANSSFPLYFCCL